MAKHFAFKDPPSLKFYDRTDMNMYKPHEARFCAGQFFSGTKNSVSQGLAVHANQKTQKLLLALLENAGKILKGRKGFRNAEKVLEMQERF